ncbi:MAG: hypothetical protein GXP45_00650 [bacterium]|nr:hypothetical protein [bacterium]
MNDQGEIIKSFSSLIKPQKNIYELKNIVKFLTGISIEQLQQAPGIEELSPDILNFFDEKTYIIGHNV